MLTARRCAVVGSPIAHSLSPALHQAAYDELGLDWTYEAVLVDSAGLEGLIDGLDESWRGLSLTMPLKRTVVPLLDTSDDWVRLSGVANTLVLDPGSRHGFNTDIPGAIAAMQERLPRPARSAVVLGESDFDPVSESESLHAVMPTPRARARTTASAPR